MSIAVRCSEGPWAPFFASQARGAVYLFLQAGLPVDAAVSEVYTGKVLDFDFRLLAKTAWK
jgi:hypothetical protein